MFHGMRRRSDAVESGESAQGAHRDDTSATGEHAATLLEQGDANASSGASLAGANGSSMEWRWPVNYGMTRSVIVWVNVLVVSMIFLAAIFLPSVLVELEHVIIRQARILGQSRHWSDLKVALMYVMHMYLLR